MCWLMPALADPTLPSEHLPSKKGATKRERLRLVVLAEPTRIGEPGCEFVLRDVRGVMCPVLGIDPGDHERPFALGKLAGKIVQVRVGR